MSDALSNETEMQEAASVALAVEKYAGFLEDGWEDAGVRGAATLIRVLGKYYALLGADIEKLRAGRAAHQKWLDDRVQWLQYEMDHGGDWKYLQLKREETVYCLEKLKAHIPALDGVTK
jgi:hypothetical protein